MRRPTDTFDYFEGQSTIVCHPGCSLNRDKVREAVTVANLMLAFVFSTRDMRQLPLVFLHWSILYYVRQADAVRVLELTMYTAHLLSDVAAWM